MGKGDLSARTGRGAPWIRVLSTAGMLGQVVAGVSFILVCWGYLDHPANSRGGSWQVVVGVIGGGVLVASLAGFTAAATYGARRTAVIASAAGLAWSAIAPVVAFGVALNTNTLDLNTEAYAPAAGLALLFAAVPAQVASVASFVGFVVSLILSLVVKRRPMGSQAPTRQYSKPRPEDTFHPAS